MPLEIERPHHLLFFLFFLSLSMSDRIVLAPSPWLLSCQEFELLVLELNMRQLLVTGHSYFESCLQ